VIALTQSLAAWDSAEFKQVVKNEIQLLDADLLPLQQGLSHSSVVSNSPFTAVILNSSETDEAIQIKTGIFYSGYIAGCNCSDDPSPMDEENEYCELQFTIDKQSGESSVALLND